MICSLCGQPTVEWKGPLTALTHTECSNCGSKNCQEVEARPDEDYERDYRDDDVCIDDLIGGNS